MEDKILEEAGLTKNEIEVYKALLQLGSITAGPLTKKAGIHRSRVYEALNRLTEKGMVSYSIQANRKFFKAQDPETLINFIEEKKDRVKEIIPELKAMQAFLPEKHEANLFEGYKGIKSIFENITNTLKKGDEVLVFGARSGQDMAPEVWQTFFKHLDKKRLEKGIIQKFIYNEDLRDSAIVKTYQKARLTEVRFIAQKTIAGINIHGDNVAFIVWKKKPYGFVITSNDVADTFREHFRILWKTARK